METKPFGRKPATPEQLVAQCRFERAVDELRERRSIAPAVMLRSILAGLALVAILVDFLAPAVARLIGIG